MKKEEKFILRETFDLFSVGGRENFFERGLFGDSFARRYVLGDTFNRFICMIIGHKRKLWKESNPQIYYCDRCGKDLEED